MSYQISLTVENRFLEAAKADIEQLCGNVSVAPAGSHCLISGIFTGDPEQFRFLKENWSPVGDWKDAPVANV